MSHQPEQTNDSLSSLLESLRDEVGQWELAPPGEAAESVDPETIRYGLYLMCMDILLCETADRGGYAAYAELPIPARLSAGDYKAFRKQLEPYILWLDRLNVKRVLELRRTGLSESSAVAETNFEEQTAFNAWIETL